jgi:hypothetical protein
MPVGATCSPCAAQGEVPLSFRHAPGVIAESQCPTLNLERIDWLATELWEQGKVDVEHVALFVLQNVYPQTPDGRAIDWRKLSIETATCLLELRRRVRARVAYVFAHHDEDAAARRWLQVRGGQ